MTLYALTAARLTWGLQAEMILRIILAAFCGGAVGIERGRRLNAAGIRTHSMVACTAAVLMIISKYGFTDLVNMSGVPFAGVRDADPARIAAQIVSGISFLGVGVIYRDRKNMTKGLTTAAGIWAVASIGMAIGAGMYLIGRSATVCVIAIQFFMHKIPLMQDSYVNQRIVIAMQDESGILDTLQSVLARYHITVIENRVRRADDGVLRCAMTVRMEKEQEPATVTSGLMADRRIRSVDWNTPEES